MMIDDRFLPRVWTDKGYYYPIFSELGVTYENKNLPFTEENIKNVNWAFRWWFNENSDMEYINTLEQCTGLKDKNGKLIYEGDILKCVHSDIMKYKIYWGRSCLRMKVYGTNNEIVDDTHLFLDTDILEVIGNIHENPELLEVQDDN